MSNPTFPDHFSGVARSYADFRPTYPGALFDHLATLVPGTASVWDCATGSGQAAGALGARFARVTATDASQEQIASAEPHPNVTYRVALAEDSGLADASVNLVTVAQALHWFDLPRFYAEVKRVLAPQGVLAVWCYGITEVEGAALNAAVHTFYAQTLGPYWPPSRILVEKGYRTLPFPFAELPAPDFRMEVRWTLARLLGYFSTWSATTRYQKATGQNPVEPLGLELARHWGDAHQPRLVSWPVAMRLGRC
ncbi:MAG: class I SAM-dependent methyltransferase [Opitutaceae bacterium]|nr:class I SAM-dependent methyltransferase [Opitutaceae bacterium]